MDNIEDRLKEATGNCLTSHAEWDKNRKDSKTRETLMEAVHELRKVAARLEIEIAISERDEMAAHAAGVAFIGVQAHPDPAASFQ